MELFINEWSFRRQFRDRDAFDKAVAVFITLIERARTAIRNGRGMLWRSEQMEQHPPVHGQHFLASLNAIGNPEVRDALVDVVFNRANPKPWQPERLHQAVDRYLYLEEVVSDTSIAELAERRLRDALLSGCLLNLGGSSLDGSLEVSVTKAGTERVTLSSFVRVESFEKWLSGLGEVLPYGPASTDPPRDEQTCLVDSQRYEPIEKFVHKRRIYRDRLSKDLLYVDNLHFGPAAHLEIFDKFGRHRGEGGLLDGKPRTGTSDSKKDYKLP